MTRTGFLQIFSFAMSLAARYEEAREAALLEVTEAQAYRLDAIEAHALCALAMAEIGLQRLRPATATLERAEARLKGVDDVHARMNIAALRMRIALMRKDNEAALREANRVWSRMPNAGVHGDLLATRALVHVCADDLANAKELASRAEQATVHIETQVAVRCIRAALLLKTDDSSSTAAAVEALQLADETGAYDPFVVAYRSFPRLIETIASSSARPRLTWIVSVARDERLAHRFGLAAEIAATALSKRELEVLTLLGEGLTNRAIARSLWISESTAKVHVRHIFEKLGVRSRTAAAVKAREILG